MTMTTSDQDRRTGQDRRMLARDGIGRRDDDQATAELVTARGAQGLGRTGAAGRYILLVGLLFLTGLYGVHSANTALAPLLHDDAHIERAAIVLASGRSYRTPDLDIETRGLRHRHIANLKRTPYVAILGASQWRQAHAGLGRGVDLYNAHVHRDYHEDMLGITGTFLAHERLPERLIISIRDDLFTRASDRPDAHWVPGLDAYRAMAMRLDLPAHDRTGGMLAPRLRLSLSLPHLRSNAMRWLGASAKPGPSDGATMHPTLDTLLPDGSIRLSERHAALFTPDRAKGDALAAALARRPVPPTVHQPAVEAMDRMLDYLVAQGVEVYLAHPPFNPVFWDAVQDSPYRDGLARIEGLTRDFASKYGLKVIGGFDPGPLGCRADQYIDAERPDAACLQVIIDQFLDHDAPRRLAGSVSWKPA